MTLVSATTCFWLSVAKTVNWEATSKILSQQTPLDQISGVLCYSFVCAESWNLFSRNVGWNFQTIPRYSIWIWKKIVELLRNYLSGQWLRNILEKSLFSEKLCKFNIIMISFVLPCPISVLCLVVVVDTLHECYFFEIKSQWTANRRVCACFVCIITLHHFFRLELGT